MGIEVRPSFSYIAKGILKAALSFRILFPTNKCYFLAMSNLIIILLSFADLVLLFLLRREMKKKRAITEQIRDLNNIEAGIEKQ